MEHISRHMEETAVTEKQSAWIFKVRSHLDYMIAFYAFVDEDRAVDSIYIEFNKAFASVSHNIFVLKIRSDGPD